MTNTLTNFYTLAFSTLLDFCYKLSSVFYILTVRFIADLSPMVYIILYLYLLSISSGRDKNGTSS